jgi:hypothetical protein
MDDALQQHLLTLLERQPAGIAEHALLKALQSHEGIAFPERVFGDDLALFRAHFLLFHALHRLRLRLLAEQRAVLEIDARCIRLASYSPGAGAGMANYDPMADYYLDLGNLEQTTAEELEQMLGAFWTRYYAVSQRGEALAVLGLDESADLATAQRRYRELAMKLHPDRGGDADRFQAVRQAIAILRRC